MDFDTYTIALLILRDDAPRLDEAALDALQDAHLAHLARLHEEGHLLAAGPVLGPPDRKIRGLSIFREGPEEARALADEDPAARAGRFSHEMYPWMVPRGAARFRRTRFPHSAAEASSTSEPAAGPDPAPSMELHRIATGYRSTQALYVVAKLGVADLLADGPKTSEDLARQLDVQPRPLFRVMRMLAGEGVFTQDASGRFGLTAMGEALRSDHPRTVRYSAIMHGEIAYRAAGELLHTVRTGEPGFNRVYRKSLFEHLGDHPADSATFNAAMADSTAVWPNPIQSYDFRGRRLLVDVGGGRGSLIASVLAQNPHLHAILYDLPQGVAEARPFLESRGVADRCEVRTGDAFRDIPGGDAIVFSRVLHDWPDAKAQVLLSNARKAMSEGGVLLLWEAVIPEGSEPSLGKHVDLNMLFMAGGAERTEAEWRSLLSASGFELTRVTKTGGMFDLVEARPV